MAFEIVVPEVGEVGMEVTFVRWLKAEGDDVKAGEALFELDTAKAVMEVEAAEDGRLADLRATEGDLVAPHQVVAILLSPGEESAAVAPSMASAPGDRENGVTITADAPATASGEAAATGHSSTVAAAAGRTPASPRARRLAAAKGIDLGTVRGSGADGLVTEDDVVAATSVGAAAPHAAAGGGEIAMMGTDSRRAKVRRAVAELTSASWAAIPHFSLRLEADVSDVLARGRPGAVLAAAVVQALVRHPQYNLGWGLDGRLYQRDAVDLGILVDTEDGLFLPSVRHAEQFDVGQLDEAIRAAARRAREGALSVEDAGGHSVTFSNLGMFSVDGFIGVIPSPDILLVSTGRIRTAPRWREDRFVPRKLVDVTLIADHRALDGADGGRLLTILERILGDPEVLP